MREIDCDVLIAGAGTGGVAAALAVSSLGLRVVLTEETNCVGGQLTSQGVPPDEHRWIEQFGRTARYRVYRDRVRQFYRTNRSLSAAVQANPTFNPGTGWVSNLCAEPSVAWQVLTEMLQPAISAGNLTVLLKTIASGGAQFSGPPLADPRIAPSVEGDRVESVVLWNLETGSQTAVQAKYFIDATELGDLLPITRTEFVTGAEASDEAHAAQAASPGNHQALTWVFAMGHDEGSHRVVDRPEQYDRWRSFQPEFWPGPLLALQDLDPQTNHPRTPPLPLFSADWRCWFKYRQIYEPTQFDPPNGYPVTIVNWPQNDYFVGEIVDVSPDLRWQRLSDAKQLSLSLLYWLQTECPRPDGRQGYPGLFLATSMMGSEDGFALTPYIRESRRIASLRTVKESDVSADEHPGVDRAPAMPDSVGIGSYRIDLHPSTGGDAYIDLATLPFQIPLGSLIPVRTRNLLPACKNIGTTHITNGCYRLHPVEWNVGEAAGLLAGFCIARSTEPQAVAGNLSLTQEFQHMLRDQGVEIQWPTLTAS